MITVNYSGGFGNNIKQYIVGCLIANKYNRKLNIKKHSHKISHQDSMLGIYKVSNPVLNKKIPCDLIEICPIKTVVNDMYCPFNIKDIYYIRNFITDTYFNWPQIPINITDNDIVISLRLGMDNEVVKPSPYSQEYPNGLRIPFKFYKDILDKHHQTKRIIICCDDFNNDFINEFNIYPNTLLAKYNTISQFQIIKQANFIISPHSSFSHMAILLSDATNTFIFKIENGIKILSREDYYF
jgi:hypothetical protein